MTYRVEYGGGDVEVPTLNAAIEGAKQAIAADAGPVAEWTVEHDEAINDWFVQGWLDGRPVGPVAVVSGPEPTVPVDPEPAGRHAADDEWLRSIAFDGITAAEAFGKATAWLAGHPTGVEVGDVGWQQMGPDCTLRIHYRARG